MVVVWCVVFGVCGFDAFCVMCVVCCLLCGACCLMVVVRCVLFVV